MPKFIAFFLQLYAPHLATLLNSGHPPFFICLLLAFPGFLWLFSLSLTTHFRIEATLKTLSSLFSTCLYHLTPFAFARPSAVSSNPRVSICSSVIFLSITFHTLIILTIALPVLFKIVVSCHIKRHVLFPYTVYPHPFAVHCLRPAYSWVLLSKFFFIILAISSIS